MPIFITSVKSQYSLAYESISLNGNGSSLLTHIGIYNV
jgi:hypothetical protein